MLLIITFSCLLHKQHDSNESSIGNYLFALLASSYLKLGGVIIAHCTMIIQVNDKLSNQPLNNVMIRIYHKVNQCFVFEDFFRSDAKGFSETITLYVPHSSYNKTHYLTYEIDLQVMDYQSITKKKILCCENMTSYLPITMLPIASKEIKK